MSFISKTDEGSGNENPYDITRFEATPPESVPQEISDEEEMVLLSDLVSFEITGVADGETIEISIDLGVTFPAGAMVGKVDANGLVTPIPGASISGSVITYEVTDDGLLDLNPTLGAIEDPVGVFRADTAPIAVPVMSVGGLFATVAGLLTLGFWGRRFTNRP